MGGGAKKESERREARRRRFTPRSEPMVVTERDRQLIAWIEAVRLATCDQLAARFFSDGGRARCQRRLTLLYGNRFIDKLPRRAANSPDVYCISPRCSPGLRLLRDLSPETTVRPSSVHPTTVQHTLELGSCRVALHRSCAANGFTLSLWLNERDLAARCAPHRLLPDAYCHLIRPTPDGAKTAAFFLEVERSARSDKFLTERLRRYGAFYYGGSYAADFHTKALRVLVLFGSDYGINPERQITRYKRLAEELGVTIFRFAALTEFLDQAPGQLLSAPIWQQPRQEGRYALF